MAYKKTWKKSSVKYFSIFGIIALVAIIGFSTVACNNDTDDSSGVNSDPTTPTDPTDPSYFLFDSRSGTITNYSDSGPKNVVIPSSINGIAVTSIGFAFQLKGLISVVIPNSVTSIGGSAFQGNSLTTVVIPDSVTSIGDRAFHNNPLTSLIIGNSVISIGDRAFASIYYNGKIQGKLTSVVIPNSVTSIGAQAFFAQPLISVTIGANVAIKTGNADGSFGNNGFETAYNDGGKLAGTYTKPDADRLMWTRQ